MSKLSTTRVGIAVYCKICGQRKKPIGRSAPIVEKMCDDDCTGYREPPHVGSLWPRESEFEFGFPVSADGTNEAKAITNLSQQDYEALVCDAIAWRKKQSEAPDGWTMVRTTFYNELLAQAQTMDLREKYLSDGSPAHGPYPGECI